MYFNICLMKIEEKMLCMANRRKQDDKHKKGYLGKERNAEKS